MSTRQETICDVCRKPEEEGDVFLAIYLHPTKYTTAGLQVDPVTWHACSPACEVKLYHRLAEAPRLGPPTPAP